MKKMTNAAEKFMHGSCRHIDDRGWSGAWLVVVDVNKIVTFPRLADSFECKMLTPWGKLCFAEKPSA